MYTINFYIVGNGELESESEPEVWDEDEEHVLQQEQLDSFGAFEAVPTSTQILAMWIMKFVMVMQSVYWLSDVVLGRLLQFFVVLFRIIGKSCKTARDISDCLPQSLYKAKQLMGEVKFTRFVVCRKCLFLYTREESIEHCTFGMKSKCCTFQRFPRHPHVNMRTRCGTVLLKSVKLTSRNTYLYPYLTYCYLGVQQTRFLQRWSCVIYIYDGKLWQMFMNYNDKPFLREPGNLGLILNFDFFRTFDHLTYSLGAIYMSVLNLPRDKRYKQENAIIVGLLPGPY